MKSNDLLLIAQQLAQGELGKRRGRPRGIELRTAVSATYYALFHTLAGCGADLLVGKTKANRNQKAWQQTYRALDHGAARRQCARKEVETRFPLAIQDFAASFVSMQSLRHQADYDPVASFSRSVVLNLIKETQDAVSGFNNVARKDRRAFVVYVLLKHRN